MDFSSLVAKQLTRHIVISRVENKLKGLALGRF